ncbi:hypothetical protein EHQ27_14385 [Leptospira wolffii]|uniref:LIC_10463 family lipoprotein n=1 Tax=Leptospira wolffii TaxID=409998 RepID=UPI00108235E2|nr:hypothetical protein [Leptospira wolffii]TGK62339.1 hypothetical protein EHQ32_05815 [Leptospira wolffii]TGK68144.1 hypothetical protein EHQ27_14385 [Leptospira wolffii]TGK74277.1 hypothetical protein EHQ35_07960 [Leptospira wolffii]TGL32148.1 hypothetical protein EHQ57_04715 [Leptospira wolffii]
MKIAALVIPLIGSLALGSFLGCVRDSGYEPLRFERISKAENLTFQANVDGTLFAGQWEYRFRIKQADRVSLLVEVLSDQPDLGVKLVRKGILFDQNITCKEAITLQTPCKLEIKNPDRGEYSLVLQHGTEQDSTVHYRIFAGVHGPGYASVVWEEEIARR